MEPQTNEQLIGALSDALAAHKAAETDQGRAEALARVVNAAQALVG